MNACMGIRDENFTQRHPVASTFGHLKLAEVMRVMIDDDFTKS